MPRQIGDGWWMYWALVSLLLPPIVVILIVPKELASPFLHLHQTVTTGLGLFYLLFFERSKTKEELTAWLTTRFSLWPLVAASVCWVAWVLSNIRIEGLTPFLLGGVGVQFLVAHNTDKRRHARSPH